MTLRRALQIFRANKYQVTNTTQKVKIPASGKVLKTSIWTATIMNPDLDKAPVLTFMRRNNVQIPTLLPFIAHPYFPVHYQLTVDGKLVFEAEVISSKEARTSILKRGTNQSPVFYTAGVKLIGQDDFRHISSYIFTTIGAESFFTDGFKVFHLLISNLISITQLSEKKIKKNKIFEMSNN